jgi:hypothetical protein
MQIMVEIRHHYSSFPYNTVVSNSSIPTNTEWRQKDLVSGWPFEPGSGIGYTSGGILGSLINIEGLPLNEYRYWILRKPKNGSYLYFWVKVCIHRQYNLLNVY